MLTNLIERFDLLMVIIPHQQLPFHDAPLLDLAVCSIEPQAASYRAMEIYTVRRRILPTLGEDFDAIAASGQVNIDLAVFTIILLLNAKKSLAH
jgi:hypothetical protein